MKYLSRIIFIGAFLWMLSPPSSAQNMQSLIKSRAMDMANALVKNDVENFIQFLPPQIIKFAGGRDQLKSKMDSSAEKMQLFGASFKKILIGNPGKIITYKGQLQCVVPQSSDIETLLGSVHAETSLIALFTDKGKTWYFIDTSVYNVNKIKKDLPDLSPDLVIPPRQEPKFTPKKTNE